VTLPHTAQLQKYLILFNLIVTLHSVGPAIKTITKKLGQIAATLMQGALDSVP
jgi:hypothetical protein